MYTSQSFYLLPEKILDLLCIVLQQDSVTIGVIYIQCDAVLNHYVINVCVSCALRIEFMEVIL